ncbi:response regulator, partial [Nitrospirota bacterium]
AIEVFSKHSEEIKMLLFDISMPDMGGKEAYNIISEISPGIAVIFMSGYITDDRAGEIAREGHTFITKPLNMFELKRKIRAALD